MNLSEAFFAGSTRRPCTHAGAHHARRHARAPCRDLGPDQASRPIPPMPPSVALTSPGFDLGGNQAPCCRASPATCRSICGPYRGSLCPRAWLPRRRFPWWAVRPRPSRPSTRCERKPDGPSGRRGLTRRLSSFLHFATSSLQASSASRPSARVRAAASSPLCGLRSSCPRARAAAQRTENGASGSERIAAKAWATDPCSPGDLKIPKRSIARQRTQAWPSGVRSPGSCVVASVSMAAATCRRASSSAMPSLA